MNLVVITGAYVKNKPDLKIDEETKETYAKFLLVYRTRLDAPPTTILCKADGGIGEFCYQVLCRADMVELVGELASVNTKTGSGFKTNYVKVKSIKVLNKKDVSKLVEGMSIKEFAELYAPSKIAERIRDRKKAYKKGELPKL